MLSLGATLDRHLPWGGLPRGALHELRAADAGAATGFAALLLARAARRGGVVLWCGAPRTLDAGAPYAPGLARFGLDPGRLVLVRCGRDAELLWAMEEGLAGPGVAAVLGEARRAGLTETRRLQLAAERHGRLALLLVPDAEALAPSAAVTRWRLAPAANGGERQTANGGERQAANGGKGRGIGPPRFDAALLRCRGGAPGRWILEWRDETGDLAVPAGLCDRQPGAAAGGAAG